VKVKFFAITLMNCNNNNNNNNNNNFVIEVDLVNFLEVFWVLKMVKIEKCFGWGHI
jgi:hypothetical protein